MFEKTKITKIGRGWPIKKHGIKIERMKSQLVFTAVDRFLHHRSTVHHFFAYLNISKGQKTNTPSTTEKRLLLPEEKNT